MTINYIKDVEGKVQVIETKTEAVVKDLYELKKRKTELEAELTGWHGRFVEQRRIELERAALTVNAEMTALQAELDQINLDIAGAVAAGVVEVIPPPEPEPAPEEVV